MEKLNELDDLVLLVNSKNNPFDNYSTVKDKTILAIAEAFRALEQKLKREIENHMEVTFSEARWKQRAEAAEAKVAELEKQEPIACKKRLVNHRSGVAHHWTYHGEVDRPSSGDIFRVEVVPLYERPAPAADLAELVPPGWKLVPVEPTPEMLEEIWLDERFKEMAMKRRYYALLAAAPSPPE